MPDGAKWIPMSEILTYEEITRICREAVQIGINRFKITGGEPLVRRGCADLIRMIRQIPGVEEVTLTTNGVLLGEKLEELLAAGLDAMSPLKVLSRGYSVVSRDGVIIKSVKKIMPGDGIGIRLKDGSLDCEVREVNIDGR